MPDITLCDNKQCIHATHCGRSPKSGTKPDDLWQTWAHFAPDPSGVCANRIQPYHTKLRLVDPKE